MSVSSLSGVLLETGGAWVASLASEFIGTRQGKTVGGFLDSPELIALVGQTIEMFGADVGVDVDNATVVDQAQDRTGLVLGSTPLLAKGVGIFIAVAFQQVLKNILLTMKSYIIRTVLLGFFFFVFIPLAKAVAIKTGLLVWLFNSLDDISRSDDGQILFSPTQDPGSFAGMAEKFIWQIYRDALSFYEDIDTFLYD